MTKNENSLNTALSTGLIPVEKPRATTRANRKPSNFSANQVFDRVAFRIARTCLSIIFEWNFFL